MRPKVLRQSRRIFFKQAVIAQRPLAGEQSVFNDAEFCDLVAADKHYAQLDADKLAAKLILKIKTIIEKQIHSEDSSVWLI